MSQLPPSSPPPPYGSVQRPPGYPPTGYPPPPGPGYGQVQPQPKTSAAAIASFVLGLLGCLGVTALLSLVFGIVGIAKTGKPMTRGRGFAIAGIVLSLLWLGGLGVVTVVGIMFVNKTAPDRATGKQFVTLLAAGQVDQAAKLCQPGTSVDLLQKDSDRLKAVGTLADTTFVGLNYDLAAQAAGGTTTTSNTTTVIGAATFSNGQQKPVQITLTPDASGKHLIEKWEIK